MKAVIETIELKRLIKATAKFISKDENRPMLQYIRLDFNKDNETVKAVAVDGYRLAIEIAKCLEIDESFSAYIKPYLPVGARAEYTTIEIIGDNCLIDVDGKITGYRQIKGDPFDEAKVLKDAEADPVTFKIAVNPQYLLDALLSSKISAAIGYKSDPVIIECRGTNHPLMLNTKKGKRMVLPVRMKD